MRDQLSHPLYTKRRRKTYFQLFSDLTTGLISIILCLVIIPGLAKGQIKSNQTSLTASSLSMLLKSIEDSIETENKNIKKLEEEDSQSKKLSKILNDEITASNFRFTTFSSFLFLPDVSVVNLENAFSTLHISYVGLEEQLNNLIKKKQVFIEYKAATDKQYSDVLKQLSEFRINKSNRKISRSIQNNLKTIKSVIGQKQNLIDKLLLFYTNEIDQLTKAQEDFSELSARYEKKLAEQKDQDLFHQDTNLFFKDWNKQLSSSWNTFLHQGKSFLTLEFWIMKAGLVQKSNQFESISFVFLFAVVLIIGWRFKRFIVAFQTKHSFQKYPSTFLPLLLLEKSAFFSWITIYFYFYLQIQSLSLISSLIRIVMDPLITWLFTGWGLVLINNWNNRNFGLSVQLKRQIRIVLLFIRWYAIGFLLVRWIFLDNKAVLIISRLPFELTLIGISLYFWRSLHRERKPEVGLSSADSLSLVILPWVTYLITFTGLIFELTGYGNLASFWYPTWGRTLIIALWTFFAFFVITDLNLEIKKEKKSEADIAPVPHSQLRWFLVRLFQLIGPIILLVAVIMAWGGRDAVFSNALYVLTYQFNLGKMSFSLMSFINAILILFVTHIVGRLWRTIFQNRFLNNSQIEQGLQESVTTVTVYVIWIFGILLSINAFGLDPTTLVVVFGALGIGLGFGLQNIFNNFMSGLILLFERPIQVGDDIEINGKWATVKKINVRSTLVQSYDNASLIIPNSDLINNQVTNWSFKDKRLRRDINVGVAYGSDTVQVKKLLLQTARANHQVLYFPEPDVLFTDFGDNALAFKLRFWTDIAHFLKAESDLRYAIEEAFRKNEIVIAFPQRDVHLHVVAPKPVDEAKTKTSESET